MTTDSIRASDVTKALSKVPFARALNITPLLMGDELTLILPYGPDLIGNPLLNALHGGAIGAFMETTAIVQLGLMDEGKSLAKPIGINIDYLRRGKPKDTYARAIVTRQGSRVANVHVRAWQDKYDAPISTLHGNFLTAKDTK